MTDAHAAGDQPRRIDRRKAMRVAGAAALGVTLSELTTRELAASAQTPQPLYLGQENTTTGETTLVVSAAEDGTAPEHGLDIWALDSPYGVAVSGFVWGVYSTGLVGGSFIGNNDRGAALELYPRDGDGPPPLGDHYSGELVVDRAGKLWLCDQSGDPDTETEPHWEQVSHRGMQFLPAPVRVLSTQSTGGKLAAGTTRLVDLSSVVPVEATGVFGNLTLAFTETNKGYVTLWPTGAPRPNTSHISWGEPTPYVANSFMAAVGTNRRVSVFASQPTHFYFDVYGYIV